MAKRVDLAYRPGSRRSWSKVRSRFTAEAIVGGVTGCLSEPTGLILGRRDMHGRLRVVGTAPAALAGRLRRAGRPRNASSSRPSLAAGVTRWPVRPGWRAALVAAESASTGSRRRLRRRCPALPARSACASASGPARRRASAGPTLRGAALAPGRQHRRTARDRRAAPGLVTRPQIPGTPASKTAGSARARHRFGDQGRDTLGLISSRHAPRQPDRRPGHKPGKSGLHPDHRPGRDEPAPRGDHHYPEETCSGRPLPAPLPRCPCGSTGRPAGHALSSFASSARCSSPASIRRARTR